MRVAVLEKSIRFAVLGVFAILLGSCGSDDLTNPNQVVFPVTNVSYKAQVAPYFALACSQTGCHDQATTSNDGVDLTSWTGARAINVAQAGDTNCHLVLVMYAREAHAGVLSANDNQRQGIKQWVIEGARNN